MKSQYFILLGFTIFEDGLLYHASVDFTFDLK